MHVSLDDPEPVYPFARVPLMGIAARRAQIKGSTGCGDGRVPVAEHGYGRRSRVVSLVKNISPAEAVILWASVSMVANFVPWSVEGHGSEIC